jgi:hypothetical protein
MVPLPQLIFVTGFRRAWLPLAAFTFDLGFELKAQREEYRRPDAQRALATMMLYFILLSRCILALGTRSQMERA